MYACWGLLVLLISSSSYSRVSTGAAGIALDAYQREMEYERQDMALDERAKNEERLAAERLSFQVILLYESELQKSKDPLLARESVINSMEKDLELAGVEFKQELRRLVITSLDNIQIGKASNIAELPNLAKVMLPRIKQRAEQFEKEIRLKDLEQQAEFISPVDESDATRLEFDSKEELLESLLSDRTNTRWVATGNQSVQSAVFKKNGGQISVQVKISFLGQEIEAGPVMNFSRQYNTTVNIMAEGLHPVLLADGNFDFHKRDKSGNTVKINGIPAKRHVAFYCDSSIWFESMYKGTGSLKGGLLPSSPVGLNFEASMYAGNGEFRAATLNSRRIQVPEYVGGKSVTIKYLEKICQEDFLKGVVSKDNVKGTYITVEDSLTQLMKNALSGLTFSHAKTKCMLDSDCYNWFNKEILGIYRNGGYYPRCVEEEREKYRACELRSLNNQICPVFHHSGKRISRGMFEAPCDKGLTCVTVKPLKWYHILEYAEGNCRPLNPKTYTDPMDEHKYIQLVFEWPDHATRPILDGGNGPLPQ